SRCHRQGDAAAEKVIRDLSRRASAAQWDAPLLAAFARSGLPEAGPSKIKVGRRWLRESGIVRSELKSRGRPPPPLPFLQNLWNHRASTKFLARSGCQRT